MTRFETSSDSRTPLGRRMRPIRWIGLGVLLVMPAACAFCVENTIHPAAQEHTAVCAKYYEQGMLVEAEARCKIAREYSPKYAEPVNLLGLIEYSRGRQELAVNYFKEAISLKNDFAEAYNNLGGIFMDRREYDLACDQFKQAIEIDPGYLVGRRNYGTCLMYAKKPREAHDEYLKCVELDPTACDCRMGLGVLSLADQDFTGAKAHFQKVTEVCPQDANGYFNLCLAYYKMQRCDDAVDACISALSVKSDFIEARQNLTAAYECLALQDQSVKEYEDQLRANPGDPELHFKLGTMFEDKNLQDRALSEYMNAVKLNPKLVMAYYRAARLLDRQLRAEETIRMCQQFVDLLRDDTYKTQQKWCINRVRELQFQQ